MQGHLIILWLVAVTTVLFTMKMGYITIVVSCTQLARFDLIEIADRHFMRLKLS